MTRLKDLPALQQHLSASKDVADAVADLSAYITLLITGTTVSGGTLTIPLLLATSAKTTAALSKLASALIPRKKDEIPSPDPAERIDEIFYVLAQKAYLSSLEKILHDLPKKQGFDMAKHTKLAADLAMTVATPSEAEARFQFGWSQDSGPLELYRSYTAYLYPLLRAFGCTEKQANDLLKRTELDARRGLHRSLISKGKDRQWLVHYQLLQTGSNILDVIRSYSSAASEGLTTAWERYLADLGARPNQPIWGEEEHGISISQLFVQPDYYYFQRTLSPDRPRSLAVDLATFLSGVLSSRRPSSELVFIMGGPGSGKTSLTDVFCAKLAATGAVRLVLIPAKRLDPSRALLLEVQKDLRNHGYGAIADSISGSPNTLIVIDGFDELAQATRNSLEIFFRSAQDLVKERSASGLRVVLTGRPTLFTDNDVVIPTGSHVVSVLPFDRSRIERWSANWRTAARGSFDGTSYFDSHSIEIREIVSQPMLLYLLARMHEEGQPVPSEPGTGAGAVRMQVYESMLDWVCRRQADKGVTQDDALRLRRFLQVAGLATHQSGRRVLHWNYLQQSLLECGLADEPSEQKAKSYSTILSFAFTSIDQKSWEFTHKSFGEALATEAIGRILEDFSEAGRQGERWRITISEVARTWCSTFGPQILSDEILDFLEGWLNQRGSETLHRILERLLEVFPQVVEKDVDGISNKVAAHWNRSVISVLGNAVRSWFAITNLTVRVAAVRNDGSSDAIREQVHRMGADESLLRKGVILCHLAAPVQVNDYAKLFADVRSAFAFEPDAASDSYRANLLTLRDLLVPGKDRPAAQQEALFRLRIAPREFLIFENKARFLFHATKERTRDSHIWLDGLSHFRLTQSQTLLEAPVEAAFIAVEAAISGGLEENPFSEVIRLFGAEVLGSAAGEPVSDKATEAREWVERRLKALGMLA